LADRVLSWTLGELPALPTEDVAVALHETLVDRFGRRPRRPSRRRAMT
ncbi:MAG: hypothetical protein QOI55_1414, partial [Actinomycetota bacterium]|nr:hypothetical protein [Actinomycetota bacterium]